VAVVLFVIYRVATFDPVEFEREAKIAHDIFEKVGTVVADVPSIVGASAEKVSTNCTAYKYILDKEQARADSLHDRGLRMRTQDVINVTRSQVSVLCEK